MNYAKQETMSDMNLLNYCFGVWGCKHFIVLPTNRSVSSFDPVITSQLRKGFRQQLASSVHPTKATRR